MSQTGKFRCGLHVALRATDLCAIWRYEPTANPAKCEGEKDFKLHSIGYAMKGGWRFHGTARPELVEAGTVIAGSPGPHYGCKHNSHSCESVCAVSLLPGALDEWDKPLFKKNVLTGLKLPPLKFGFSLNDDDQFESFVFEIFDLVSRASTPADASMARTNFRMQRLKRFIERHAFEAITLQDIARSVDLSPFTCIRQFKKATGMTPVRYLSVVRLERARQLLKNERLTIGDVGRRVGIVDRFYFARWFSKETGIPPSTFRRISLR